MYDRPVRVLVVSPPSPVWGAELVLLSQIDSLRERGVDMTLAIPRGSEFAAEWEARGLPMVDLDIVKSDGLTVTGTNRRPGPISLARSLREVIRTAWRVAGVARDYDMLFSFSLATHPSVAVAGRIKGVPVALDLVDLVRPGVGRLVLQVSARIAQLTVANSQATADTLGRGAKVQIIQPGIDLDRFHPGDPPEGLRSELTDGVEMKLIGIVGRLDHGKGAHILVDAMTRLSPALHATRLIVVGQTGTGPAEYAEELRATADALLGDRVRFLGRRNDVPDIMRALDVLVVASASEPFGLTALEAQASRTPVIGTRAGGLPEFVVHEETGLLVAPFDAGALAAALERLLTDDKLRTRLVDEAERRTNPHRGLEAQYDEVARMYGDICRRSM